MGFNKKQRKFSTFNLCCNYHKRINMYNEYTNGIVYICIKHILAQSKLSVSLNP